MVFLISGAILAVISILFGLLILVMPRALNYLVAIYLMLSGIIYFVGQMGI